jgi:uncharacterized protein YecT (DUF1311 family)
MPMRLFLYIMLSILVACSAVACATSAVAHRPQHGKSLELPLDPCANADTTYAMNMCYSKQQEIADARLALLMKSVMLRLDELGFVKAKEELIAAQSSWQSYRQSECDYEVSFLEGGTAQAPMFGYCSLMLTLRRVDELQDTLDFVNGAFVHEH